MVCSPRLVKLPSCRRPVDRAGHRLVGCALGTHSSALLDPATQPFGLHCLGDLGIDDWSDFVRVLLRQKRAALNHEFGCDHEAADSNCPFLGPLSGVKRKTFAPTEPYCF